MLALLASLAGAALLSAYGAAAATAAGPASPVPGGDAGLANQGADEGGSPAPVPKMGATAPGSKRRAAEWHETGEYAGPTYNCVGDYYEELGRAWAGWYGDVGISPQVNDVYYVKAGWGISGFPCGTGGARVHVEMVLPAYTKLAITQANRVRCFYKSPQQSNAQEFQQDCPQNPGTGWNGGPSFDPPGEAAWPTATGALFEIWVPVKSTQPLNGITPPDPQPCTTCLYVGTWMIDGNNSPWVWPKMPVYVTGSASAANPSVSYPAPATGNITYNTGTTFVEARLYGNVYTEGTGGTARFEMGPSKGNYDSHGEAIGIPTGGNWQAYEDWQMTPGRTYHWRLCYTPSGSGKICGADQTINAPPETAIADVTVKKPKHKATFTFSSPEVPPNMSVTYQCRLDNGAFQACSSPKTYSHLSGKHTFSVRAVDQAGHKDASPAKESFKI